jgi:hypothetical protein
MLKSSPLRPNDPAKFQPTIHVDQYAIDTSMRFNKRWCMGARGLAITLRQANRIEVTAETVRFNYLGYRYIFTTPERVAQQVIAFDDGKKIKPWSFRLTSLVAPPTPVETRGPYAPRKKPNKTSAPARRALPVNKQGVPYKSDGKPAGKTTDRCRRWHGIKPPRNLKSGALK